MSMDRLTRHLPTSLLCSQTLPALIAAIVLIAASCGLVESDSFRHPMMAMAALCALLSVVGFAFIFRRLVTLTAIENQLNQIGLPATEVSSVIKRTVAPVDVSSDVPGGNDLRENEKQNAVAIPKLGSLTALYGLTATACGWNRLVDTVQERRWSESLDRRLSESPVGSSSDRMHRVFRSHPDGIAITDRDGIIQNVNPAWLNLVGIDEFAPTEKVSAIDQLGLATMPTAQELIRKLTTTTSPIAQHLQLGPNINDGVWRISRTPMDGRADDPETYIWILRDCTQQALSEQARDHFVSAATHELRTPLSNIRAYAETLADAPQMDADSQREFYNIINMEALRLGRLLDQLLNLQQMEAGSLTLDAAPCDLLRLTQEVYDHMRPLAEQRNLRLEMKAPPSIPPIRLDKEKIASMLINLLGNAVKYTLPNGTVRLIVEVQATSVAVAVEDTGIGISEEDQARVFERFYRCKDARVEDQNGNGLGLALAREVVMLHGGDLTLSSKLNEGSRFTVTLPLQSTKK